jgi:hypothetical protein
MTRITHDACPFCGAKVTARQEAFPANSIPFGEPTSLTEFRCGTKADHAGVARGSRCMRDERDSAIFTKDGGDA